MVETSTPTAKRAGAATAVQQRQWEGVGGDDDGPKPSELASFGVRRSCDQCGRRKKKCDRELPCRRCRRKGDECTYSKRRWHLPGLQEPRKKKQQHPQQQQKPGHDRVHVAQVLQPSTSSAVAGWHGMLSFKRCRLSASPATGLVGMQENNFLSDFFGCVGFLPLTTQSHIRETMVKIMLHPASRQQPAFGDGCGETKQPDGISMAGGSGNTFGGKGLPMGPSACIFWCAVALGALVKGSPIESVAIYSQRATDALAQSHSGPADAGVAQAWTNLAYLYGFMGDTEKFQEYLALSETFLAATIKQGSTDKLPVGLAEIIRDREKSATPGNMESVCSGEQVLPQLNGILTEHELYRYVMQSFRVFEQAIYSKMLSRSRKDDEPVGGADPTGEGNGDRPHHIVGPQPQDMSDAMARVWFEDNLVHFGPLEEAVDRPSIRAGVGGMLINGCLGFEAAGDGDVRNTLKRFGRCVEVFVRYPGLCRFQWMGAHKAHIMMAGLAALDISGAREEYERLRVAYNSARPLGSPPAPPIEEWQGMCSICEDLHCRAMERLIAGGHMSAFSTPRDGIVSNESGGVKGEEVFGLEGQSHSGHAAANIAPKQEALRHAPCSPGSSETGSGNYDTCDAGGFSRVADGGSAQCLESTGVDKTPIVSAACPDRHHSATELDEEDETSSDIDVMHGGNGVELSVCGMVAAPHEAVLMPEELGEGAIAEMEDPDIAAADWLDVTHALLDSVTESSRACC